MQKELCGVKIFANKDFECEKLAKMLEKLLTNKGFVVCDNCFDIAIAVGGDGAFLKMVKACKFNKNCNYVGINSGSLGFLQEIKPTELESFVEDLVNKNYNTMQVGILQTQVKTNGALKNYCSLNEIVVRDKNLNTAKLNVFVGGEFLEKFTGDGLLISSSVGSTAYNLSFGGSIVYSGFNTMQITPIAPINSKIYRSLTNSVVLPDSLEIKIVPENKNLILSVDGENNFLDNVEYVKTNANSKKIKLIKLKHYSFCNHINEKFLTC